MMKFAYPVATPESDVPLMSFWGDFENHLDSIGEMGYQGVELLVRDPEALSVHWLESALERRNLQVAGFGTSPMIVQDKLSLLSKDRKVREKTFRRVCRLLDMAACFQAPVGIGKLRGNITKEAGCTPGERDEIFLKLCDYSRKINASMVMEPQKPDNVNHLNTIDESLEWLAFLGREELKLLVDTYHMAATEKDQCQSIQKAAGRIGFVHLADSGRMAPGSGNLDFKAILEAFQKIGYAGYFSMEISQEPGSRVAAQAAMDYLKHLGI